MELALAGVQWRASGILALVMQTVLACLESRAFEGERLVGTGSSLPTAEGHWLELGCKSLDSFGGRFVLGCSRKRQIGPWVGQGIGAPLQG